MRVRGLAFVVMAATSRAEAQGFTADLGYVPRDGADVAAYRLGFASPLSGPVWWQVHGILLKDNGADPVSRYGAGVELNAWRGRTGPYVAASLDAGIENGGPDDVWGSWTAGVGYDLGILSGLSLATDLRWRGFLNGEPGGVQWSVGLGYRWGGKRSSPASPPPSPAPRADAPAAAPATEAPGATKAGDAELAAALREGVVATARGAMGQPYRYGGEGEGGFDCSGLIQYAYAQHGITVPRVSTDQALVGDPVDRSLERLVPGDILTFSASPGGSRVSHVGLYVGEGRFIHSASSRGVSESRLAADDPNGAWWYARWVGARRIVTSS